MGSPIILGRWGKGKGLGDFFNGRHGVEEVLTTDNSYMKIDLEFDKDVVDNLMTRFYISPNLFCRLFFIRQKSTYKLLLIIFLGENNVLPLQGIKTYQLLYFIALVLTSYDCVFTGDSSIDSCSFCSRIDFSSFSRIPFNSSDGFVFMLINTTLGVTAAVHVNVCFTTFYLYLSASSLDKNKTMSNSQTFLCLYLFEKKLLSKLPTYVSSALYQFSVKFYFWLLHYALESSILNNRVR